MQVPSVVVELCCPLFSLLVVSALAGCAYGGLGPLQPHNLQFNADAPHENTATVCSAYGSRHKSTFTFTHYDIATFTTVMASNRSHTAAGDRSQMDCVDEATNTTSYLSVLAAHGLLDHYKVLRPMAKPSSRKKPRDNAGGRQFHARQRAGADHRASREGLREPLVTPQARA